MAENFDIAALLSPPDILKKKRILCIQPHPDDNEIGMGGTIAVLAKNGCEVHYLTVTNGDQGNNDAAATMEQTAQTRRMETEAAGKVLGAKYFHYLEKGDGTLSGVFELSLEIAGVIRKVQPEAIFCPDPHLPYEAHLDHIVTGRAAANAFIVSGRTHFPDNKKPWRADAIGYYFSNKPNTIVDISGVFEQKFTAIQEHKSQMDMQTLGMYRIYFEMKGNELAAGKGFALGEGLKVLSGLHSHCFVDAERI